MRRLITQTITMLALTSFMAITALADSPHFISCSASGVNDDGSLSAAFKIAGLGANQSLTVTASATANAVYGCLNHGQQCPNAANKISVSGNVSATGTFTSGKNGQITASLTVDPPPPPSTFSCPGGQTLVLVSVSYTNVSVSAPVPGDGTITCTPSPGTFAANFFPQCP
jgi:hypothetical protein